MTKKLDKELRLYVECAAGDCAMSLLTWRMEQDSELKYVYIESLTPDFYSKQVGILRNIWNIVRAAWFMLRGKEYQLTELIVTDPADLEKLAKFFTAAAKDSRKLHDSYDKK